MLHNFLPYLSPTLLLNSSLDVESWTRDIDGFYVSVEVQS